MYLNLGVPEGEEEEQETENLFENTLKESFPNLVKEIDIQVQEAQRVPNKMDPKKATPRHIIIKMSKVREEQKSSRRKAESYLQRSSHVTISRFLKRNYAG